MLTHRRRTVLVSVLVLVSGVVAACQTMSPHAVPEQASTSTPEAAAAPPPQGTPDWRIANLGSEHAIEGYADQTSVTPGQPLHLYVSTTARTFTVTAYRIGNYLGSEARQVWRSDPHPGSQQPAAAVKPSTNTITAQWQPTLTVDTKGWDPGDYLLRLDGDTGVGRFVPVTVRTPSNAGRIVVVNAVTTWQAYNRWGGYSLYDSPSGKKSERSRAVSFDRPYQSDTMQGAGDFLYFEMPFLLFAERSGRPLGYVTDVDLHADPHLLDGAAAVITLGHDEYWSANMRNNVTAARDQGVNLAFLGGNEMYRHIRFEDSPVGANRVEVDYKSFDEDPASRTHPLDATQEWRSSPNPRPESVILGNYYQCNPVTADMVVSDAKNWLLDGIVADRQKLPGMVGNEYAQIDLDVPTPRPIEALFHSPLTCQGKTGFADASYYTTPSGAAVFSTGTQWWICGLDPGCTKPGTAAPEVVRIISAITTRLLDAYAAGPAGATHPAVDNLVRVGIPGATPLTAPILPAALVPN
ncbi:hypothetical protein H5400_04985 [Rhodococcus wratislaviensis]|nr:hypothetical protein [Rhodococcus sp. 3A]MBC2897003.1 hypothetical protein [Rhodococcus sp. 4CII]